MLKPDLTTMAAIEGIGKVAGRFVGDVEVSGDIRLIGADCAEEFVSSPTEIIEPGTVMVRNQAGNLEQSHQSYDKKVVELSLVLAVINLL